MSRYSFRRRQIVAVVFSLVLLIPSLTYGTSVTRSSNIAVKAGLAKDFFDQSWGVQPDGLPSARYIAGLDDNLAIYTANIDVSPILGPVQAYSNPRLIFAKDDGLVQVLINFDTNEYNQVYEHLKRLLGEPNPIIYERMVTKDAFDERTEWWTGKNTKVVLVDCGAGTSIELSKRAYFLQQKCSFEELFTAALLKQASEYERQNRILESSSIYQELLTGTQSYQSYIPAAQEHLAKYSQRTDVVDYLGKNNGLAFSVLKNIYSDTSRQLWLRIELDAAEQEELNRQQDSLAKLSSVLCRVQLDGVNSKYIVAEQIWLDESNQIIGGRPAWAPQEASWPATYIKQACEEFLVKWFSFRISTEK